MKIKNLHSWNLTLMQAEKIQEKLQKKIILKSPYASIQKIKTVAGTDVHFSRDENFVSAGIVILSFPELKILEKVRVETKVNQLFPYLPGFLSFREIPFLLTAFKKIKIVPDVILCDGQGIAHPWRIGLATHLGIILNKPTIGCAKSLLYGDYEKLPERAKGSYSYLWDRRDERDEKGDLSVEALAKAETIGAVLRTKDNVRPVFVSPGHKMNLKLAVEIVLKCCTKYRLPEPLRYAHQVAQIYPVRNFRS